MAAPMPKSVSGLMREKIDCLEGECVAYECAYLSPTGWSCIFSRCSACWMVIRIRSHWLGYFLLLSISDLVMDIERAVYLG